MFRKGKALGELGYFERAEKVLEELKTKNPTGISLFARQMNDILTKPSFQTQQASPQNSRAYEPSTKLKKRPSTRSSKVNPNPYALYYKLSYLMHYIRPSTGFLSREKPEKEKKTPSPSTPVASTSTSGIEEIMSPGVAAASRS